MQLPPDVPFSVNRISCGYTANRIPAIPTARNSRATLHSMFSLIPTLTNSNCTLLDLLNAGKITYSVSPGEFKGQFVSAQGTLIPVFPR